MKNRTVKLFTVRGIPVGLDPSWFLIFALITWSLAVSYFPSEFKNWTTLQYWSVGIGTSLLFFASVLLHELGHSLVAIRYKHTVNSITLYIFGGISEIATEVKNAVEEFVIAFAGPLTSLLLSAIFYIVALFFKGIPQLFAMLKYLALINVTLAVFNLIPGFPLDGGRVFRSIVWAITKNLRKATEVAGIIGRIIAYLFILFGVWEIFQGNWINGLWIAFIGWFLDNAAGNQVRQQRVHDLLAGHTVEQVMSRSCVTASADLSLQALVDEYVLDQGQRCLIMARGDQPAGLLTLHNIRQVPREKWGSTPASEIMTPIEEVKRTSPETGLAEALEQMGTDGVNQLPVMKGGQIEGMLRREDIVNYLQTLHELEK